jgi:hypothetical protein
MLSIAELANAALRESVSYSVVSEVVDAGGCIDSSQNYQNFGSVGMIGGIASSASYSN